MGTRADFYVGRGVDATWLGSIAWDDGVFVTCFGYGWRSAEEVVRARTEDTDLWESDAVGKTCVFPNMKDRKNVTYGKRSGVTIIGPGGILN